MTFKKILGTSLLLFASGVSAEEEFTRYAIADVSPGQGDEPKEMQVSSSQHPVIKFSVANIPNGITGGKLRFYAAPDSEPVLTSYQVRLVGGNDDNWTDDDWDSVDLTNDENMPWLDHVSVGVEPDSDRKFVEFNLGQYSGNSLLNDIVANGLVTIQIKNPLVSPNLMASSEVSDYKYHPKLVLNTPSVPDQNDELDDDTAVEGVLDYKFRMSVGMTHDSYEDPILYPGEKNVTHHHMFLGNGYVNRDSTPDSLKAETGVSKLWMNGDGVNRTGYWVPVMYDGNNEPVPLGFNQIYYTRSSKLNGGETGYLDPNKATPEEKNNATIARGRWENGGKTTGAVMPMPEGLTMVTQRNNSQAYNFVCIGHPNSAKHFDHVVEYDKYTSGNTIPKCNPNIYRGPNSNVPPKPTEGITNFLQMKILFPDCWNGIHLTDKEADAALGPDENAHTHMAYSSLHDDEQVARCPANFVQLPQVIYQFAYPIQALSDDTSKYYLSSDTENKCGKDSGSPHGCSAHGDWMNGWEPEIMKQLVGRDENGDKLDGSGHDRSCLGALSNHCSEGDISTAEENMEMAEELKQHDGVSHNFVERNTSYEFSNHEPTLSQDEDDEDDED